MRTLALVAVVVVAGTAATSWGASRAQVTTQQDFKVGGASDRHRRQLGRRRRAHRRPGRHRPHRHGAQGRQRRARAQARRAAEAGRQHHARASSTTATAAGTTAPRSNFSISAPGRRAPRGRDRRRRRQRARLFRRHQGRDRRRRHRRRRRRGRDDACARAAAASKCATCTAPSTCRPAAARCASRGSSPASNRVETGGGSIHVAIPGNSRLAVDASTGGGSAHNDFGIASDGERHSGRFHGNIGDGWRRLARDAHRRRLDLARQDVARRARAPLARERIDDVAAVQVGHRLLRPRRRRLHHLRLLRRLRPRRHRRTRRHHPHQVHLQTRVAVGHEVRAPAPRSRAAAPSRARSASSTRGSVSASGVRPRETCSSSRKTSAPDGVVATRTVTVAGTGGATGAGGAVAATGAITGAGTSRRRHARRAAPAPSPATRRPAPPARHRPTPPGARGAAA